MWVEMGCRGLRAVPLFHEEYRHPLRHFPEHERSSEFVERHRPGLVRVTRSTGKAPVNRPQRELDIKARPTFGHFLFNDRISVAGLAYGLPWIVGQPSFFNERHSGVSVNRLYYGISGCAVERGETERDGSRRFPSGSSYFEGSRSWRNWRGYTTDFRCVQHESHSVRSWNTRSVDKARRPKSMRDSRTRVRLPYSTQRRRRSGRRGRRRRRILASGNETMESVRYFSQKLPVAVL